MLEPIISYHDEVKMEIENIAITGLQKRAMIFCLEQVFCPRKNPFITFINCDTLVKQINDAEVVVETTPYYCMVKFLHKGFSSFQYDKTIELQVTKKDSHLAPMVFHMHFSNNILYEFEYFNGDSSEINEEEMFTGVCFEQCLSWSR